MAFDGQTTRNIRQQPKNVLGLLRISTRPTDPIDPGALDRFSVARENLANPAGEMLGLTCGNQHFQADLIQFAFQKLIDMRCCTLEKVLVAGAAGFDADMIELTAEEFLYCSLYEVILCRKVVRLPAAGHAGYRRSVGNPETRIALFKE